MANTVKLVLSFNVHTGRPIVRTKVKGLGMWFVTVYAENFTERITIELENLAPCDLPSMHELIMNQLNEAAGELSPITKGGFRIFQK